MDQHHEAHHQDGDGLRGLVLAWQGLSGFSIGSQEGAQHLDQLPGSLFGNPVAGARYNGGLYLGCSRRYPSCGVGAPAFVSSDPDDGDCERFLCACRVLSEQTVPLTVEREASAQGVLVVVVELDVVLDRLVRRRFPPPGH